TAAGDDDDNDIASRPSELMRFDTSESSGLRPATSVSPLVDKEKGPALFSHLSTQSSRNETTQKRQKRQYQRQPSATTTVAAAGAVSRLCPFKCKPESRLQLTQQLKKYKRLLPYVTERMLVLYIGIAVVVAALVTLVINLTDKQFSPKTIVCTYYWGFIPGNVFVLAHFVIFFPVLLWRVWDAKDAYGIRTDLIICETAGFIAMVITLVWVNALDNIQQIFPGLTFIWIYSFFIHASSVFFPLLRAIQHTKKAKESPDMSMGMFVVRQSSVATGGGGASATAAQPLPPSSSSSASVGMTATSTRRANFNRMMDDPAEYQQFREFAAS
ncbi:hypothetical protein IWW38_006362, partial [Coemansia aciculifera]